MTEEKDKVKNKSENTAYISYDKMSVTNYPSVEDSVMSINKKAIENLTPDKGMGTKIIKNHINTDE